jgi:hypothetical protein
MPRYYRFGYQPHDYESNWHGHAQQATLPAAETHGLSDITDPSAYAFGVPRAGSPYALDLEQYQRAPEFFVPKADSPYWRDKHVWGPGMGAIGLPSLSLTTWFLIGVAGVFAYKHRDRLAKMVK